MVNKRFMAILLSVVVLIVSGCSGQGLNGTDAPAFVLSNLAGQQVSLTDLRGRPVVINFWQLSCPPCIEELPGFQSVYDSTSEAHILTVAIGNSISDLNDFTRQNGYSLPVLVDTDGSVATSYGVRYTPTTVFIDSLGRITDIKIGAFTSPSQIQQAINKLN